MRERFAPLTAFALHAAGAPDGRALPWDVVGHELQIRAEAERKLALPVGVFPKDMEDSRFAVYAWIDEVLLTSSRNDAALWASQSLQQRYFGTSSAGTEFYRRLSVLLTACEQAIPSTSSALPVLPLPENTSPVCTDPHQEPDLTDLPVRIAQQTATNGYSCATLDDSAHHALAVYAQCLVYGFRGRLFRPEDEPLLHEFRLVGNALLKAMPQPAEHTYNLTSLSASARMLSRSESGPQHKTREGLRTTLRAMEPALHLAIPLLICAGFYVYCAAILAAMIVPK